MAFFSKSNRDVAAVGDFGHFIGTGQVPGITNFTLDGESTSVDSIEQDLWSGRALASEGGTDELDYPIIGEQLTIRSTSANDSASGTGARAVSIVTIDFTTRSAGSEFLFLNGTTKVDFASSDTFRISGATCIFAGSNQENDGDIIIERKSDSKYRYGIIKGFGSSRSGRITIPDGFIWTIAGRFYNVPKDSDCKIRIRSAVDLSVFNSWFDFGNFDAYQSQGDIVISDFVLAIPPRAEFRATATASNPDSTAAFTFFGRLIDISCISSQQVDTIKKSWEDQTPMHLNI